MNNKVKIINIIVLFGLVGCESSKYSFVEVTGYAISDITSVNCVLSRNSSAFWETLKEDLIIDNLDVCYEKIDEIAWDENDECDLSFHVYKEDQKVSIFYLVDSYIYTEIEGLSYRTSEKMSQSVVDEIIESIIR